MLHQWLIVAVINSRMFPFQPLFCGVQKHDLAAAKSQFKKCIAHIAAWMKENKLKLNKNKTDVIVICHSTKCHKLQDFTVKLGDTEIVPATSARNVSVIVDQNIIMVDQVTAICKVTIYHIVRIHWEDTEVSHQGICRDCHPCIGHISPRQ